jgi:hypothetical protein
VAPEIAVQLAPSESHRRQAYAYELGLFDHVPVVALSVLPAAVVPEIVGRAVLAGGAGGGGGGGGGGDEAGGGATTPVGAEVDDVEPFLFVATTVNRIVEPTSAAVSTYVVVVTDSAAQVAPVESQRLQRPEYEIVGPLHVPSEPVRVLPCTGVPLIVGAVRLAGGLWPGGVLAAAVAVVRTRTSERSDARRRRRRMGTLSEAAAARLSPIPQMDPLGRGIGPTHVRDRTHSREG